MQTLDLSTKFADTKLQHPFYNASGAKCMTYKELKNLSDSNSAAVLSKSCTPQSRTGNPEPRYIEDRLGSINSMGLPNEGLDFYLSFAEKSNKNEKPYFISLGGLTLEDNLQMLETINSDKNVAAVELNLSCPNIAGKPQTAYDFDRTKEVLQRAFDQFDGKLGVKLPPYFDIVHFEEMAKILNNFPLSFVTCINSIGNGLIIDAETETVLIKPKGGFGGIGGDYIKPTALANVRKFYELLKPEIAVIACGGVKTGVDAFEHILCGASAVQVGTQFMREGISVFDRLQKELSEIMQAKGYEKLEDFRGKLKMIN